MKKENKVISLNLARKISEVAKAKHIELAKSEKVYIDNSEEIKGVGTKEDFVLLDEKELKNIGYPEFYPAYDCSELGKILPMYKKSYKQFSVFYEENKGWKVECSYKGENDEGELERRVSYLRYEKNSLSEAMGKMLYFLMENDLLK